MRALLGAMAAVLLAAPAAAETPERFAVYYTNALPAERFADFDLMVFDSDAHPDFRSLKARGRHVLGYLSLGEAGDYRAYMPSLQSRGLLLGELPSAKGHYYIDMRNPAWVSLIVESLIPALLRQGFDGLMLDTVDTASVMESAEPKRRAGMKDAAARLIKTIRLHYPDMPIMVNRGFDVLPQIAGDVNMVLAESIYSFYDAKEKQSRLQPAEHYASVAAMLKSLQAEHAGLKIYTLDYWPPDDAEGVRAIYAAQRAQGFVPYVSTYDLQDIHAEPTAP